MNTFISVLVELAAKALPSFLLRWLFHQSKIGKEIGIDLHGEKPIQPRLTSTPRIITLFFDITNHSHFDVVLNSMTFDLWFGQPTLVGYYLKRVMIKARSTKKEIYFWTDLTTGQAAQIDDFIRNPSSRGTISFDVTAYFESRAGPLEVKQRIERHEI